MGSLNKVVLFDGECNLCNTSVQFIIKRDPTGTFQFASLQSDIGKRLLSQYHVPENIDSIVLIDGEKCYFQSTAALRVCKNLSGAYKLLYLLIVIPKPIRNYFYAILANNRYKWFGKNESCMIPSSDNRKRFLS